MANKFFNTFFHPKPTERSDGKIINVVGRKEVFNKAFLNYYTKSKNGDVDLSNAEKISSVYTCIKILSENISRLELSIVKNTPKLGKKEFTQSSLYDLLKYQPTVYQNIESWLQVLTTHLYLNGNAFAWIEKSKGVTSALPIVEFGYIDSAIINDGRLWYYNSKDEIPYPSESLLHFSLPVQKNQFFATNPLEALRLSLNIGYKAESTVNNLYENNAQGTMVLETSDNQANKKINEAIEVFKEKYAGYENAGDIIVPPPLTKLKEMKISVEDAKFLDSSIHSEQTVAAAYGVPRHLLGHSDEKFSTFQEAALFFKWSTMAGLMSLFTSELNFKLVELQARKKGINIEFNQEKLIDASLKEKADVFEKHIKMGAATINEVSKKLGYKGSASEYADMHYIQGAQIPVEKFEEFNFSKNGGAAAIPTDNNDDKEKDNE